MNLDAEISEMNKKTAGTLNAELIDVQIAAIGESEPIRAKGRIAADFAKERFRCNADLEVNQKPLFHLSADLPACIEYLSLPIGAASLSKRECQALFEWPDRRIA